MFFFLICTARALPHQVGMGASASASVASLFDGGGVLGGVCAGGCTDLWLGGRLVATSAYMCALGSAAFACWAAVVRAGDRAAAVGGGSSSSSSGQSALWNGVAMAACGFLVAGPDGILGGACAKNLCDYNELPHAGGGWGPAVSGLVNGLASCAVIAMSFATSQLVEMLGWAGLFSFMSAMMAAAAFLSAPAALLEARYFQHKR
jgi:hypothetical protein